MLSAAAQIIGSAELVNETSEKNYLCTHCLGGLQSLTVLGDQSLVTTAGIAKGEREVNRKRKCWCLGGERDNHF